MSRKWMIRATLTLSAVSLAGITSAVAQVGDVVDPNTGNYVPGKDPLGAQPKPRSINPLRVNRRLSNRVGKAEGVDPQTQDAGTQAPSGSDASPSSLRYPDWWPK